MFKSKLTNEKEERSINDLIVDYVIKIRFDYITYQ